VQLALGERVPDLAGLWLLEDAEMHAVAGQCAEARREASAGLALSRDNVPIEHAARALAVCGEPDEAEKLAGELAATFPEATLTARVQIPIIHAAVALARGDAARAREVLGPVRPYDHAATAEFWPSFLRAEAHLRLARASALQGNVGDAREQYRDFLRLWRDADRDLTALRAAEQERARLPQ
jgi:tetratricopeptide (TPR) repeat protein